jgi:para-nitrobenzyl esterase
MGEEASIAKTNAGEVRGRRQGATVCFRGIPYGATTAAERRWLAPSPAPAWVGVLDAMNDGAPCPQPTFQVPGTGNSMALTTTGTPPGEGCLSLNVWTPGTDGDRRPVMVWLHGGGYGVGAGTQPLYDGERLATRGDTVVVCVNHRIGPLGYLHLDELGGERFHGSGNAGNLDLVLALEWVRDNIAAFGGDPGNVTIFGESGGGRKVTKMLAMPSARGLFHRAIIQSGAQPYAMTAEQGTEVARALMEKLGVGDVAGLQAASCEELLGGTFGRYGPVVDGDALPSHPIEIIAAGAAADVPVIVGTTEHEAAFGMAPGQDDAKIRARLQERLGADVAAKVLPVYEAERPDIPAELLAIASLTDRDRRLPAVRTADALVAANASNVYMYVFAYPGAHPKGYAPHGCDVAYTFDRLATDRPQDLEARHVADQLCDAWLAFARTGDPNHAGMATWAPYDTGRRATLLFEAEARCVDDPWSAERQAWDGIHVTGML